MLGNIGDPRGQIVLLLDGGLELFVGFPLGLEVVLHDLADPRLGVLEPGGSIGEELVDLKCPLHIAFELLVSPDEVGDSGVVDELVLELDVVVELALLVDLAECAPRCSAHDEVTRRLRGLTLLHLIFIFLMLNPIKSTPFYYSKIS